MIGPSIYILESFNITSTLLSEIKSVKNHLVIPLNYKLESFLNNKDIKIIKEGELLDILDYEFIDKITLKLSREWYRENNSSEQIIYHNVDISKTLQNELYQIFLRMNHRIILMQKLIEKYEPESIKISKGDDILHNLSKQICDTKGIKYEILQINSKEQIENKFDKVSFSIRVLGKNKEIRISKKSFMILKYFYEKYWDLRYLIQMMNSKKKISIGKSVLFLDFNLILHENFLRYFSEKNYNLLFMNNRRPIIWNKESLKISKKIIFNKIIFGPIRVNFF